MQSFHNVLNLPECVKQNGTTQATYVYLADGTKAEVYTGGNPGTGSGYSYLGSLRYTKTGNTRQLESTPFAAGRFVKNTGGMQPYYHITDHLGSIRVITDKNGTVQEQNDYYPYGGRHTSGNTYAALPGNNHKFNGKEEQTTANIGYLDYGARMYDNVTGRWGTPDPLAEKYKSMSPYNYCLNNPVMFVDPDGRKPDDYFNQLGIYLGSDNRSTDFIRIINDNDWDRIRTKNEDGSITYNNELAGQVSVLFSQAEMDTESALSVYYHYNMTGLPLDNRDKMSPGMSFNVQEYQGQTNLRITIPLEKNQQDRFIDNANNIINSFIHENKHYNDFKKFGKDQYVKIHKKDNGKELERRAIHSQIIHPSYQKTTERYKSAIHKYWIDQK